MNPYGGGLEFWDLQDLEPFLPVVAAALLLWFANMALTGWLAGRKGRDDGLWTVIATFVGPIALVAVIVIPRRNRRSEPVEMEARAPYSGSEWPKLPSPPDPITTREQLLGALLGAGLAASGAALIAAVGDVELATIFVVIGAAAGGLVGFRLSGTLIEADRSKLVAVGLASGVLILSVNALLTLAVRIVPALLAGGPAGEVLWLALTGVVALVGAVLYPLVTPLVAPGLLAVSLFGGVVWAAITRFLVRRDRPPGAVASPATRA